MRKRKYQRTVGVLLSEETYQALVRITDNEEVSISKYIRGIVEDKISRKGNQNDEQ